LRAKLEELNCERNKKRTELKKLIAARRTLERRKLQLTDERRRKIENIRKLSVRIYSLPHTPPIEREIRMAKNVFRIKI